MVLSISLFILSHTFHSARASYYQESSNEKELVRFENAVFQDLKSNEFFLRKLQDSCNVSQYLDQENHKCNDCMINCLGCSNNFTCYLCQNGYILNENNQLCEKSFSNGSTKKFNTDGSPIITITGVLLALFFIGLFLYYFYEFLLSKNILSSQIPSRPKKSTIFSKFIENNFLIGFIFQKHCRKVFEKFINSTSMLIFTIMFQGVLYYTQSISLSSNLKPIVIAAISTMFSVSISLIPCFSEISNKSAANTFFFLYTISSLLSVALILFFSITNAGDQTDWTISFCWGLLFELCLEFFVSIFVGLLEKLNILKMSKLPAVNNPSSIVRISWEIGLKDTIAEEIGNQVSQNSSPL